MKLVIFSNNHTIITSKYLILIYLYNEFIIILKMVASAVYFM